MKLLLLFLILFLNFKSVFTRFSTYPHFVMLFSAVLSVSFCIKLTKVVNLSFLILKKQANVFAFANRNRNSVENEKLIKFKETKHNFLKILCQGNHGLP